MTQIVKVQIDLGELLAMHPSARPGSRRFDTMRAQHDRSQPVRMVPWYSPAGPPNASHSAISSTSQGAHETPSGIMMFYDVGQGQSWQRNIVMNGSPHLPPSIRQWFGDSRGHWEGDTLVIDVTNFSPKADYRGSRENLHLIERWTRTSPTTLEYVVTIEDPTVWTRPWAVKQEFTKQSDQENRLYYEPRCIEGNYGLPGLMRGARAEEIAFAEGRGPHPATKDNATDFVGVEDDPLR